MLLTSDAQSVTAGETRDPRRRVQPPLDTASRMETNLKTNVLLVDDEPKNLFALRELLGDLDQNLISASSGEEALRHVLKNDFAVILLDVRMPGLDGFDTARMIRDRERSRHTPIVFLTAA